MSINPNGFSIRNSLWSLSASHTPPLYSPTMAVFGPTRGFSSRTSSSQSFSASGSFVKVLLQNELGGDRVDRLLFHAPQPTLCFHRSKAFVDARHRQMEATFELPREFFDSLGEGVLALLAHRQPHHELCRLPFFNQLFNLRKRRDRG